MTPIFHFFYTFASLPNKIIAMSLKSIVILAMIGCLWHSTAAQNPVNMKFGKPTKEEMQMTEYALDPNADAVMLCRLTDVNYTVQQKGFLVDYHERIRIKVLKPEGARFASVTIPYTILNQEKTGPKASKLSLNARYFSVGSISSSSFEQAGNSVTEDAVGTFVEEDVQEPKATAYNMENGKVKKTKLRSSDIVKEKVGDESYEVRFTVPDVRQGTVIEYEYTIHSQLFYRLRDWTAQCDMPVAFARLEMDIPVYLAFNIEEHGIQRLNCTCTTSSLTYKLESDFLAKPVTIQTNHYVCVGRDLKAMSKDAYVWNINDYRAGITAELKSFSTVGTPTFSYVKTWNDIDRILLDDEDFGKQLNNHSPLHDEMLAGNISGIADEQERAAAVCRLVFNKVKWDGKYDLWPENTRKTLNQSKGSNADINMLLIQSLHDVGLNAVPVLLRQRDKGLMPYNFPSLQKLTTFVVGIQLANNTNVYVDASSAGGYLNVLPENLLVERAHLLTMGKSGSSVNLQKTVRSQTMTIVNATLANDGTMSGTQTTQYRGLSAQHYRQKTGKTDEFAMEATEEEKFTIKGDVNHDTIHIVPFYMPPLAKNCFTSDKRLMPVEFPSEMSQQVVVNITLPEGYTLAEIPQQVAASTPDKSISGIYFVSQTDNKVQIDFQFKINKVLHQVENYDKLRGIFDLFHKCSTQSIAIKKL